MQLVVFTDLDGTLLDHDNYSYAAAQLALTRLKQAHTPLILASSKTAAEVAQLHAELELGKAPAIVENGAGIYDPCGETTEQNDQAYRDILRALDGLPQTLKSKFVGFSQLTVQEVSQLTGLSLKQSGLAKMRQYSEPGVWQGDEAELDKFLDALEDSHIKARRGGRFLTLSFGQTKADQMAQIAQAFNADKTVALGDAPNDIEMIQGADIGVIVRNDHGPNIPRLEGEALGAIWRTTQSGPNGWNTAILDILNNLNMSETGNE